MIVSIASFKGGVAKTTTAIHVAAYLQQKGSTLLVDAAPTQSALAWASSGNLPFEVATPGRAIRLTNGGRYEHIVFDTDARPEEEEMRALVEDCDLLVVPTIPEMLSLRGLLLTAEAIKKAGALDKVKVLLTIIPPRRRDVPSQQESEARAAITEAGLPLFHSAIPDLMAYQKAALAGVPVYGIKDARADVAWKAYEDMGREVLA